MKILIFLIFILININASINKYPKDSTYDISTLKSGKSIILKWNNLPILIYKRTINEVKNLKKSNLVNLPYDEELFINSLKKQSTWGSELGSYYLLEKETSLNQFRSKRDDIFIAVFKDTLKGRVLSMKILEDNNNRTYNTTVKISNKKYFTTNEQFYNKKYYFDLTGRYTNISDNNEKVFNLYIPPHNYKNNKLIIGLETRLKDIQNNIFDTTPYNTISVDEQLFYGAGNCRVKIVKQALKDGADVNKIYYNSSSIHEAVRTQCKSYRHNIIKEILKYKPNLNKCSSRNYTVLDIAIITNDIKLVKELLEHKIDINFKCSDKSRTDVLVYKNDKYHKEVFDYLKTKGYKF